MKTINRNKLPKQLRDLPAGMIRTYLTCDRIINHLMTTKGESKQTAESMVHDILMQFSSDLRQRQYTYVNQNLLAIFGLQSFRQSAINLVVKK